MRALSVTLPRLTWSSTNIAQFLVTLDVNSNDGTIRGTNTRPDENDMILFSNFQLPAQSAFRRMSLSADHSPILVLPRCRTLRIHLWPPRRVSHLPGANHISSAYSCAISSNHNRLRSSSRDGRISLYCQYTSAMYSSRKPHHHPSQTSTAMQRAVVSSPLASVQSMPKCHRHTSSEMIKYD